MWKALILKNSTEKDSSKRVDCRKQIMKHFAEYY
jgi:hypothetical protein